MRRLVAAFVGTALAATLAGCTSSGRDPVVSPASDPGTTSFAPPASPPADPAKAMRAILARRWVALSDSPTKVSFSLPEAVTPTVNQQSGIPIRDFAANGDGKFATVGISFAPLAGPQVMAATMLAYPAAIARALPNVKASILDKRFSTERGHRVYDFRIRFHFAESVGYRVWVIHLVAHGSLMIIQQVVSYTLNTRDEPEDLKLVRQLAAKLAASVTYPSEPA